MTEFDREEAAFRAAFAAHADDETSAVPTKLRATRRWLPILLAAVLVAIVGATSAGVAQQLRSDKAPVSGDGSTSPGGLLQPIVIAEGEVFVPTGRTATGSLTAQQAAATSHQNGGVGIPANATVQAGTFSMEVGRGLPPLASGTSVYAFSWHSCGPHFEALRLNTLGSASPPASASPSEAPTYVPLCTEWSFVDSKTGLAIDTTWAK